MVSTGDSSIPSSCEMKHVPVFMSLHGNLALYRVSLSLCPVNFKQQTQGPSQIPIAERSLTLRCLWKVGIPLESIPGNQTSSRDDLGYTSFSRVAMLNLVFL